MIYRYRFFTVPGVAGYRDEQVKIFKASNHKEAWKQAKASLGLYRVLGLKIEDEKLERGILKKVVTREMVFKPIQEVPPRSG